MRPVDAESIESTLDTLRDLRREKVEERTGVESDLAEVRAERTELEEHDRRRDRLRDELREVESDVEARGSPGKRSFDPRPPVLFVTPRRRSRHARPRGETGR